jgi:hypothetical protein
VSWRPWVTPTYGTTSRERKHGSRPGYPWRAEAGGSKGGIDEGTWRERSHSVATERILDLPTALEEPAATGCYWGELKRPRMPALPPRLRFFAWCRVDEDGALGGVQHLC